MHRYSFIILATVLGLLVHPAGDALAGPAREGERNQAARAQAAKPGAPATSAPFVVVIDPGHGGRDAGSRGALLQEKDFTLRAAKMLAALLSRRPEVKAILTREADTEMTAVQRASVANYNAAALFLTLHADASWRPGARGPAIMVAAPRRPPRVAGEPARAVAFRWQRSQNIHLASNRRFALNLQKRFAAIRAGEKPPLHILAVRDLEGARMPAAYVSLGVISTPEDEARLSEIAEEGPYLTALAGAVLRFAGLTEDLPPKPAEPAEAASPESSQAPESSEQPESPQQPESSESQAAPSESPQPGESAPEAQNAAPAGEGR